MLPDGCAAAFRVASTTLDASAFVHGEAAVKPISSVAHTPAETEVTTIIVQSVELLRKVERSFAANWPGQLGRRPTRSSSA